MSIVSFFDKIESPVSVFCAFAALVATIIIAVVQYKQGKRMEELERNQVEEENRRNQQRIDSKRNEFIIKYTNEKKEIDLLPLCWVSNIYFPTYRYSRKMYTEFNALEEDVQKAICDYLGFTLKKPQFEGEKFYNKCVEQIIVEENKYRSNDDFFSVFYENAKYLLKGLLSYGNEELPNNLSDLEGCFTDYLSDFYDKTKSFKNPTCQFANEYGFHGNEQEACEVVAVIAKCVSEWGRMNCINGFWYPDENGSEIIERFEDLFLNALFSIYAFLIAETEDKHE